MTAIYRLDSVAVPIQLYKQETVILNTLFRELQLCDSLTILDKQEIATLQEINTVHKFEIKKKNEDIRNLAEDNGLKDKKLKRNRKGFAISAGIILVRLGIRLGLGI